MFFLEKYIDFIFYAKIIFKEKIIFLYYIITRMEKFIYFPCNLQKKPYEGFKYKDLETTPKDMFSSPYIGILTGQKIILQLLILTKSKIRK